MTKNEDVERLCYTVKEVAKLMGICEASARSIANRKNFPKILIGRKILIPKRSLRIWINKNAMEE